MYIWKKQLRKTYTCFDFFFKFISIGIIVRVPLLFPKTEAWTQGLCKCSPTELHTLLPYKMVWPKAHRLHAPRSGMPGAQHNIINWIKHYVIFFYFFETQLGSSSQWILYSDTVFWCLEDTFDTFKNLFQGLENDSMDKVLEAKAWGHEFKSLASM